MEIKVYATLRQTIGSQSVHIDDAPEVTIDQILQELYAKYPALRSELFINNRVELNPSIHVLINGRDMRYLDGLETVVTPADDVRLFPPVGGGV